MKVNNILCKLFGHKFIGSTKCVNGVYITELKCSRCGCVNKINK